MSTSNGGWKIFDPNSHVRTPAAPLTAMVVTNAIETVDLSKWRTTAAFKVNGVEYQISGSSISPRMSLAEYIRKYVGLTGTKIGCNEGGCGACTVILTHEVDSVTSHVPINACLRPVGSCDGMSITTIEGIGTKKIGLHPIQSRMVACNASQCGFCTPGWISNMYGLLLNNAKPDKQEIQDHFDGNICRCTGYRSILSAMGSFAADDGDGGASLKPCAHKKCIDIEDLCAKVPFESSSVVDAACVSLGSSKSRKPLCILSDKCTWYAPNSIENLIECFQNASVAPDDIEVILGNTTSGILKYYDGSIFGTKAHSPPKPVVIELRNVAEMQGCSVGTDGSITIGGAKSLNQLIALLKRTSEKDTGHLQIMNHLQRVASNQIRNVGGFAGNLSFARQFPTFPSDCALLLCAAGATLSVISPVHLRQHKLMSTTITVEDYLASSPDPKRPQIIVSMTIPSLASNVLFQSFKMSVRRENSHATINFAASVSESMAISILYHIENLKGPMHAKQTEGYINALPNAERYGQTSLTNSLVKLQSDMISNNVSKTSAEFYQCQSLLYKVFLSLQKNNLAPDLKSATLWQLPRPVSEGTEVYTDPGNSSELPVSKGYPKLLENLQVTGEAKYTNDIETKFEEGKCLYGAFIKSTKPLAIFQSLNPNVALEMEGVVDILTASDIPGKNDVDIKNPGSEFLFTPLSGVVECVGQPLGLVLATSQKAATNAAQTVQALGITFKDTGDKAVLSLEEAIEKKQFFDLPQTVPYVIEKGGDIEKALASSPNTYQGTINFAGQRHFYMETQRSFVRPREGGDSFELYTSTQDLDLTQQTVANLLKVPQNKIIGKMTRAGGAFGGKLTRGLPCAMAATLAACKHQLPVKVVNERVDDLIMTGGRERGKAVYTVGFDNDGRIIAFQLNFYMDSGFSLDISDGDLKMAMYWADNVYNIPNWSSKGYLCKTNTPTNTAMRAPGVVHSIHTIEHALHNISKVLGVDPVKARETNFYSIGDMTPYAQKIERSTLLQTWSQVQQSANYSKLKAEVDDFNSKNRWVKRGIHVAPVKYGMQHNGYNIHAIVNIFSDGSISLSTGGLEVGQGLNTKVAQCCAFALKAPLELINVSVPNSTEKIAVSSNTGGSATSECACEATMLACKILTERLEPYSKKFSDWRKIVQAASNDNVLLSATAQYCPPLISAQDHFRYFVWGSALSIVELDVLTGESQILRSDIVYDCGVSLNPMIDLGQVEGAFCFGIGTFLLEEVVRDVTNGQMLSNGTWNYKPPTSKCIPVEFNVAFLKGSNNNPHGILSSKATGEPPYALANSVYFALRYCIDEARKDNGYEESEYELDIPATQARILKACGASKYNFTLR